MTECDSVKVGLLWLLNIRWRKSNNWHRGHPAEYQYCVVDITNENLLGYNSQEHSESIKYFYLNRQYKSPFLLDLDRPDHLSNMKNKDHECSES